MRALIFALPLIIAAPLVAAQHGGHGKGQGMMEHGPAVDVSKITGGTYTVESTHTLIGWRVNHFGFNDYFGIFGNPTGTLNLDKANPANSSVTIDIPINQLYTASDKLTGHMKSKDFFNAELHPTAKFASTRIQAMGQHAMIYGNLTILGVTKPVTLHTNLSGSGTNMFNKKETVGFHAKTSIKRSDFGMGYGIPNVSDKVDLDITVAFEK